METLALMLLRLIAVFLPALLFAQQGTSLRIYVCDTNNQAVEGAVITTDRGSEKSITQKDGSCELSEFPTGPLLIHVQCAGFIPFDTTIFVESLQRIQLALILAKIKTTLTEIDITTGHQTSEIFSRDDIRESSAQSLPEFLAREAGLDIRSDGSPGSPVFARMNGSNANQVMILIDGQRASEPGSGEADLSSIPLEWIEQIEIIDGADFEKGGQAIGGILSISTRVPQNEDEISAHARAYPSYSTVSVARSGTIAGLSAFISFLRTQGDGTYTYRLSEDDGNEEFTRNLGETFQRKNNDITRDQLFAKLLSLKSNGLWSFAVSADNSERGMPGYIAPRPTPLARQNNRKINISGDYSVSSERIIFNSHASHSTYRRDFSDPDPFSYIHEAHESGSQNEMGIKVDWKQDRLILRSGVQFLQNILHSDQLISSRAVREQFSGWSGGDYRIAQFKGNADIRVSGGIRIETFENNSQWLPQIGLSADVNSSLHYYWDANFSRAYRAPDLYSLFWAEDFVSRGNPNLLPEQSSLFSANSAVETKSDHVTKLKVSMIMQHVTNLIYWKQAFDGHWMPFNLKATDIASLDIALSQELPYQFIATVGVNWLEARDATDARTTGGKYLTFRPPRTHRFSLNFTPGHFHFEANYRWIAARPVLDTNYKWLREYSLLDLSCSYRRTYSHLTVEPSISILNATDETYRIIRYAPMPQREFVGSIQLTYTL